MWIKTPYALNQHTGFMRHTRTGANFGSAAAGLAVMALAMGAPAAAAVSPGGVGGYFGDVCADRGGAAEERRPEPDPRPGKSCHAGSCAGERPRRAAAKLT